MRVLISAAEASSDAHGAELLKALRLETSIEAYGVGGPKLQAAGLRAVVDARELLAMGFVEILGKLPRIFAALRAIVAAARLAPPDVAVVIDYPDFHFRLARRLKRLGIPVVYYIPPKVWVWRKGRVRVLRESFAKVLSILPFEVPFYEKERVPVTYVGNPLSDELPLGLKRPAAREALGLSAAARVITLMPGSRPAELRRHLDVMLDGALRAAAILRSRGALGPSERLVVLIPLPATADLAAAKGRVDAWLGGVGGALAGGEAGFILDIRLSQGNAAECLVASEAGLIKSGTSTLEAALLGCPHAIVYRTHFTTQWIFKYLIRYRGPVGLTNLVAGGGASAQAPRLVREILLSEVRAEVLCDELVSLLSDEARRATMLEGLAKLKSRMLGSGPIQSPSARAAREVLEVARR